MKCLYRLTNIQVRDHPEFKEMQNKVLTLESEMTKHVSRLAELKQEYISTTNKLNLSESTCDKYATPTSLSVKLIFFLPIGYEMKWRNYKIKPRHHVCEMST